MTINLPRLTALLVLLTLTAFCAAQTTQPASQPVSDISGETPVFDAPATTLAAPSGLVANDGSFETAQGEAVEGTLSASAPEGATLTYAIVDSPAHGQVELTDPAAGTFTYSPEAGYEGADSFTYRVTAGAGQSNVATVSVNVAAAEKSVLEKYFFPIMLGGMVLIIFLTTRKPRQQEKHRREMLSNLKKGDRITTIGGVVGTILEIKDDEITIKIDESTNTRMRFARWAVRDIGEPKDKTEEKKDK